MSDVNNWIHRIIIKVYILFLELDECSVDNLSNCSEYANCTDIMGSYMCECNPGYTGNGSYCEGMLYLNY